MRAETIESDSYFESFIWVKAKLTASWWRRAVKSFVQQVHHLVSEAEADAEIAAGVVVPVEALVGGGIAATSQYPRVSSVRVFAGWATPAPKAGPLNRW